MCEAIPPAWYLGTGTTFLTFLYVCETWIKLRVYENSDEEDV